MSKKKKKLPREARVSQGAEMVLRMAARSKRHQDEKKEAKRKACRGKGKCDESVLDEIVRILSETKDILDGKEVEEPVEPVNFDRVESILNYLAMVHEYLGEGELPPELRLSRKDRKDIRPKLASTGFAYIAQGKTPKERLKRSERLVSYTSKAVDRDEKKDVEKRKASDDPLDKFVVGTAVYVSPEQIHQVVGGPDPSTKPTRIDRMKSAMQKLKSKIVGRLSRKKSVTKNQELQPSGRVTSTQATVDVAGPTGVIPT